MGGSGRTSTSDSNVSDDAFVDVMLPKCRAQEGDKQGLVEHPAATCMWEDGAASEVACPLRGVM